MAGSRIISPAFTREGLPLAGKARGLDAGGWFDAEIGADADPKSISHEHTYSEDTADTELLESTLVRLSKMVGRRLRDNGLYARTVQLKLRYGDFSTLTRAHSLSSPTQLDGDIREAALRLFRQNRKSGSLVRLLGVQASSLDRAEPQPDLLGGGAFRGGSPSRQVWRRSRLGGIRAEK